MQSSSHSPAVLCAFDVGHRHFVCVTLDNRIKLWDTHTGNLIQQYSEPQHLAAAYTSLAWTLSAPLPPPKKRASSSSSSTPQLGYLALGGRTGAVTVLNLSTGEFAHASASSTAASASASSAKVLAAPVLAVAFHAEQKLLLASSADAFVHRFSFPSLALLSSVAAPHPVTLIPPAPHSSSVLVALGPALHLVDLSSPSSFTVEKHWAAAAGDLCSVAATTDGALYATGPRRTAPPATASPIHVSDVPVLIGRACVCGGAVSVRHCSLQRSLRAAVERLCGGEREEEEEASEGARHADSAGTGHAGRYHPGQPQHAPPSPTGWFIYWTETQPTSVWLNPPPRHARTARPSALRH